MNCHQVACPVLGTQVADMPFVTILVTCALQGSFCLAFQRLPPLGSFLTPPLTLFLGVACFGVRAMICFQLRCPPSPDLLTLLPAGRLPLFGPRHLHMHVRNGTWLRPCHTSLLPEPLTTGRCGLWAGSLVARSDVEENEWGVGPTSTAGRGRRQLGQGKGGLMGP